MRSCLPHRLVDQKYLVLDALLRACEIKFFPPHFFPAMLICSSVLTCTEGYIYARKRIIRRPGPSNRPNTSKQPRANLCSGRIQRSCRNTPRATETQRYDTAQHARSSMQNSAQSEETLTVSSAPRQPNLFKDFSVYMAKRNGSSPSEEHPCHILRLIVLHQVQQAWSINRRRMVQSAPNMTSKGSLYRGP